MVVSTRRRFSLDDAAIIYRTVREAEEGESACPTCGGPLAVTCLFSDRRGLILVRCDGCGRTVVVERAEFEASAGP